MDGNELASLCGIDRAIKPSEGIACTSYIRGITEGAVWTSAFVAMSRSAKPAEESSYFLFCSPTGSTVRQHQAVVMKYVSDHPELRHLDAPALVIQALQEGFPKKGCK